MKEDTSYSTVCDTASSGSTADNNQQELDRTILHLKQLNKENAQHRQNFEDLRKLHVQLTAANRQLEGRWCALQEGHVALQRQHKHTCHSLQLELDAKQQECDQLKAQASSTRDASLQMLKLREEVEASYKHKYDQLLLEIEKERGLRTQAQKEASELSHKYRVLEHRMKSEAESVAVEHSCQLTAMAKKLREHEGAQGCYPR